MSKYKILKFVFRSTVILAVVFVVVVVVVVLWMRRVPEKQKL